MTRTATFFLLFGIFFCQSVFAQSNGGPAYGLSASSILGVVSTANGGTGLSGVATLSYPTSDTTLGASLAIGSSALSGQTSSAAYGSTAIGYQSLDGTMTTNAVGNTALGYQALQGITTGSQNIGIGWQAANGLTTGNQNTVIGYGASLSGSGTGQSVAVGQGIYSGQKDVIIGQGAGDGGNGQNVVIGWELQCGGGYSNVCISGQTHAASSIAIGYGAGSQNVTGTNNVIIGPGVASTTLTSGAYNVVIGAYSNVTTTAATSTNTLNIGNLVYGTGLGTSGATPTGVVGIGTATIRNSAELDVNGLLNISSSTLISSSTSLTNGAGSSAGTLTNAPAVGNPTKWIPINDNGTTRYIPAW